MKPLNRIARKSFKMSQLFHEYIKQQNGNQEHIEPLANILIHHNYIRMFFKDGDLRFYKTPRAETFDGIQTIKRIAERIVKGLPVESIIPESHTHLIVTDMDGADLGMIEDMEFRVDDQGRLVGAFIEGINIINYLNDFVIEDLEVDLAQIRAEQKESHDLELSIDIAKEDF